MLIFFFFFFNDTATTEIYTLPLHDALPILTKVSSRHTRRMTCLPWSAALRNGMLSRKRLRNRSPHCSTHTTKRSHRRWRSEEHTSELQSQSNLVCRLLLEKKKRDKEYIHTHTSYAYFFFFFF